MITGTSFVDLSAARDTSTVNQRLIIICICSTISSVHRDTSSVDYIIITYLVT